MFIKPTYKVENKLYKLGFKNIAGLDEVGRGAWAGPVVAAAVILPPKLKIKGLKDSKLLTSKKREELFIFINKNALRIGLGIISEKIIDEKGIISATRQAFLQAIEQLSNKADYLLVDGIKIFDHELPLKFFIKGDQKIMSIAAASIIAKVSRDNILKKYDKKYPKYGFSRHKGYGTILHKKNIFNYGICDIHRKSFKPIMNI